MKAPDKMMYFDTSGEEQDGQSSQQTVCIFEVICLNSPISPWWAQFPKSHNPAFL